MPVQGFKVRSIPFGLKLSFKVINGFHLLFIQQNFAKGYRKKLRPLCPSGDDVVIKFNLALLC